MKLTNNGDWILQGGTEEYTYECNISQLNPGRKMYGLDVDNVVTMIQLYIHGGGDNDVWSDRYDDWDYECYYNHIEFYGHKHISISLNGWCITLPAEITPTLSCLASYVNNLKLNVKKLLDKLHDRHYRICKIVLDYQLLYNHIEQVFGSLFLGFGKEYHNCTKEFLVAEFAKTCTINLYIEMIKIYAWKYGLHLVNGDQYTSFKDVIRWEVCHNREYRYYEIACSEPSDPGYGNARIVRFGDTFVGF